MSLQMGAMMQTPSWPQVMWILLFKNAASVQPMKGARKTNEMTVQFMLQYVSSWEGCQTMRFAERSLAYVWDQCLWRYQYVYDLGIVGHTYSVCLHAEKCQINFGLISMSWTLRKLTASFILRKHQKLENILRDPSGTIYMQTSTCVVCSHLYMQNA